MKILMLEHPQMDLGTFNLYNGLCDSIGDENIIVFPQKSLYFGKTDDFSSGYPAFLRKTYITDKTEQVPYGIPPFAPNEDVINGYPQTRELPYLVTRGHHSEFTEDNVVSALKAGSFDFIILSSSNRVNTMALARLRDRMGGLDKLPPIIYYDTGERDEFNEHWWHVFHPKVTFKLILTPKIHDEIKNKLNIDLHCLPHSSCLAGKDLRGLMNVYYPMLYGKQVSDYVTFNDNDKCFDIYHAMGITHESRSRVIAEINEHLKGKHYIAISTPGHYHTYLNYIAHSKIAVTMRGSGRDTSRYWDIPTFNTAMMCDESMGCLHPHPFVHRKTAIFYNENTLHSPDGESIGRLFDIYLEDDKARERIARAGKIHLLRHHTNEARAEQFMEIVDKELRQI